MKKYLSVLFVAVFALALTGCGKGNTLTCKGEQDGQKAEVTLTFKGDKVTKVVTKTEMESKEAAQETKAMYDAFASMSEDAKGTKVSVEGKNLVITMSGDALEDSEFEGTKEEIKKDAEENGFTCK